MPGPTTTVVAGAAHLWADTSDADLRSLYASVSCTLGNRRSATGGRYIRTARANNTVFRSTWLMF